MEILCALRARNKLPAWLYKILFNKFDHHRRRKYTRGKYIQEADELVFLNSTYIAPISECIADKEILAALDKLSDHYRSVILLADVHEFDYKEIAEVLGIPIGTVMSRLSRARGHLKKSLAGVANEYGIGNLKAAA